MPPRKERPKVSRRKRVKRLNRVHFRPKSCGDNSGAGDQGGGDEPMSPLTSSSSTPEIAENEMCAYLAEANSSCSHAVYQPDNEQNNVLSNVQSLSVLKYKSDSTLSRDPSMTRTSVTSDLTSSPPSGLSCRPSASFCLHSPEVVEQDEPSVFVVPSEPSSPNVIQNAGAVLVGVPKDSSGLEQPSLPLTQTSSISSDNLASEVNVLEYFPPLTLIQSGLSQLIGLLPSPWISVADRNGFHLLLLSGGNIKAIQRDVFISYEGEASIAVHSAPLPFGTTLVESVNVPQVRFEENTVEEFCKRAHGIIQSVMQYKICVGGNHMETKDKWENIPDTYVDANPYLEESYEKSCRSLSCSKLIKHGESSRCDSCEKVMKSLLSDSPHTHTPNAFLTREQLFDKVQAQCEEIKRKNSKIVYHTERMSKLLDDDGVDLDSDLNDDFNAILANASLTDVQRMFFKQQMLCSGKNDPTAHRWHPCLIRLALHIKMQSSSADNDFRNSGFIKLSCNRTLYDYRHAIVHNISAGMFKIAAEKVSKFVEPHQKYVALIFYEFYTLRNLVYRKSDENLIGYVYLNRVEKEMIHFDNFLTGNERDLQSPLASRVMAYMAYMVKGLTTELKFVLATYPVDKDTLYQTIWGLISRLERADIKVLCVVCDGSSMNRSFIGMNTPYTVVPSGVIFDTLNWCTPDARILYFISDVAHLIKTIRNCFYNSGEDPKKSRCLQFNGQKIEWKTIVQLYLAYQQYPCRKSFKLNSQNVFPDLDSSKNVKHAVTVLSETVATDIAWQKWKDTEETVNFLRRWNKFFDCLNGVHSDEHIWNKNPDLAPYTDVHDLRFDWLQSCVDHLEEWRKQAKILLRKSPTDQERSMLSQQAQCGIEMSIRGFSGATKFLLKQGAKFVMARDLSQDHLESRQTGKGQVTSQQVAIDLESDLQIEK